MCYSSVDTVPLETENLLKNSLLSIPRIRKLENMKSFSHFDPQLNAITSNAEAQNTASAVSLQTTDVVHYFQSA
jgi:hypothetical protein